MGGELGRKEDWRRERNVACMTYEYEMAGRRPAAS